MSKEMRRVRERMAINNINNINNVKNASQGENVQIIAGERRRICLVVRPSLCEYGSGVFTQQLQLQRGS
jgi:hypothetical protein